MLCGRWSKRGWKTGTYNFRHGEMMEDARKTGLKNGLRQLTVEQILKVLAWPHEMVLDTFNYEDGKFCPLAVGVGIAETMCDPTHDKVFEKLISMGYTVYNTRGITGRFYMDNRKDDLIEAAKEVLAEMGGTE